MADSVQDIWLQKNGNQIFWMENQKIMAIIRNASGNSIYPVGKYESYEDTSFEAGDSPLVLDVYTDLGKKGNAGYVSIDGAGDLLVEVSQNISSGLYVYGEQFTLKSGDILDLTGLDVMAIRLTHSGTNTAYRVLIA